jgi:2,4-dienoyl-CoA reductase-like NADH-dependent reductase (Old Yellow Enzyme family)
MKMNGDDDLILRDGLKTPELVEVAVIMEREGVDAVEITVGHYESGFCMARGKFQMCMRNMVDGALKHVPPARRWFFRTFRPLIALGANLLWSPYEGFNLQYARHFKQRLRIPVICVGGFRSRVAMESAIAEGGCDAVSSGRAFIADPHLYRHLRDGVPGPRCVECNACIGHLGSQPAECYHPLVKAEKDAMLAREG